MSSRTRVLAVFDASVDCVAWSPDGRRIAVGLRDGRAVLLDAATGTQTAELSGHRCNVTSVRFSVDSRLLATAACDDSTVLLWDVSTGQCVRKLVGESEVTNLIFFPCGQLLLVADVHAMRLWRVADGTPGPEMADSSWRSVLSADGALLASADFGRSVNLWHMPEGTPGHILPNPIVVYSMAFSPCAPQLVVGGAVQPCLALWDPHQGTLVRRLTCDSTPLGVAWSPDGKRLAVRDQGGIALLDASSGARLLQEDTFRKTEHTLSNCTTDVVFASSGKQIVFGVNTSAIGIVSAYGAISGAVRIWTVCKWSDRTHHLFSPEFKQMVFHLMCVRDRLHQTRSLPFLPVEMWLLVFEHLQLACE